MNSITQHEDDEEKAKARLLASFDYLLNHNGSGHLEVNTKILKRGQKEVTIQCSRCHRFIVDMKTKIQNLMKLGLDKDGAKCVGYSRKGYWRVAQNPLINIAISNSKLERAGFLFFLPLYEKKVEQEIEKSCKYLETAVYRTVRTVV